MPTKSKEVKPIPRIIPPRGYHFKIEMQGIKKDKKKRRYRLSCGCCWSDDCYNDNNKYIKITLLNSRNRYCGHVSLESDWVNSKVLETHSFLAKGLRNKGIGSKLYAKAIQVGLKNGLKVRSSGCSSPDAIRMWEGKTIRKYFSIRKIDKSQWEPKWGAYLKRITP